MSWVREAIDEIKAKSYEELYPTAHGGSAKEPDVSPHPRNTTPSSVP